MVSVTAITYTEVTVCQRTGKADEADTHTALNQLPAHSPRDVARVPSPVVFVYKQLLSCQSCR